VWHKWPKVGGRDEIEKLMSATPPGSHGRVVGVRPEEWIVDPNHPKGGYWHEHGNHVFNVWNDGKRVWAIDAQSGTLADWTGGSDVPYVNFHVMITDF
jgi:hypothetical protein